MHPSRRSLGLAGALLIAIATAGCGDAGSSGSGGTAGSGGNATTTTTTSDTGGSTAGSGTGGSTGGTSTGGSTGGTSTGGSTGGSAVTADALLALTQGCDKASNGDYATDDGEADTISICKLNGAFFWHADMDIDCDGKQTQQCNLNVDPAYQNQTSLEDSTGQPLDAANLPFVVVPLPSARFDYQASDIHLGGVVAVIYKGQLRFGIFGDEGPDNIIGEASYAMASSLGIDPDPSFGGVDTGVTYIVFTGADAVVSKPEDNAEAITLGTSRAATLLGAN